MKHIVKKVIIVIVALSLMLAYYLFYWSFEYSSYFKALKIDVKMLEAYPGPYYRIIYGTAPDNNLVYLVYIKNEGKPYTISEKNVISKAQALKIASQNGYDNIEQTYLLLHRDSKEIPSIETLAKDLIWRLYYDVDNGYYVEIDFKTGDFLDSKHK